MKIPLLKNIFSRRSSQVVGIDIGLYSAKAVQLRYDKSRAVLETYGELLVDQYLKTVEFGGAGFLHYAQQDVVDLLRDLLRESKVSTKQAVFGVPSEASFATTINFPPLSKKEIAQALPFEARKYIPIPISEVVLEWDIAAQEEGEDHINVLLVAVPKEVVAKIKNIAVLVELEPSAVEVEAFAILRSIIATNPAPTAIIDLGYNSSLLIIADKTKLRVAHTIDRGSNDLTRALERGLGITQDRAEDLKREVGLSSKLEEREVVSVIVPLVESFWNDIERIISLYNRKAPRKVQNIILVGGGANLKQLTEYVVAKFGVEVSVGNPFAKVVAPPFLQPMLREIGPSFATAVGLALHGLMPY